MTATIFDDDRASWGAEPSTNPQFVDPKDRTGFMTHWNGDPVGITEADPHSRCLAFVKNVQDYHQTSRGWADIGYATLLCTHSRIIEGRGLDLVGAHCSGYNTNSYSCMVMLGTKDGVDEQASPEMLERLRLLYDDLGARNGKLLDKFVHSDGASTACPGEQLRTWVHDGMLVPQGDTDPSGDEILAAMTALRGQLDMLGDRLSLLSASVTEARSALTRLSAEQTERHNKLVSKIEGLTTAIPEVVQETLDASLGGIETTTRFTRR